MKKTDKVKQVTVTTYKFTRKDVVSALLGHFDVKLHGVEPELVVYETVLGSLNPYCAELYVQHPDSGMLIVPEECHICNAKDSLFPREDDPGIYVCNICKTRFIGDEDDMCFYVRLAK